MDDADLSPARRPLRLLFADADTDELAGTVRALQRMRPDWEISVVDGYARAMAQIATGPIDVVVSDLHLTDGDGVGLLGEIRRLTPSAARVVVAADSDRAELVASTRVAHQFLTKPCNVERLRSAIDRIVACRSSVPLPNLHELIGEIDDLPSPGPVHQELAEAMQGDYSISTLEAIVTKDVALTAELLRLVNSSFFGLVRQLDRLGDAISFLGIDVLTAMVASRSLFRDDQRSIVDLEELNRHSHAVAELAAVAQSGSKASMHLRTQAFAAGLLHDVGVLVLDRLGSTMADQAAAADVLAEHDLVHERFHFGADRYSLGRLLLSLWGFDDSISEAIGSLGWPATQVERSGLGWTLRIAHEAIMSGRITPADVAAGDEIELKMALAEIVDELDVRGTVARPLHRAA